MPSSLVLLHRCMLPCFYTFWHHPYILYILIKMFLLHLFDWFILCVACKMCINMKIYILPPNMPKHRN